MAVTIGLGKVSRGRVLLVSAGVVITWRGTIDRRARLGLVSQRSETPIEDSRVREPMKRRITI